MRRIQLLLLAMICTLAAQAQIADGYYRVKSSKQGRYARVLDNRGSINLQTTDADMGALCTQRSWDIVVSDPGSVIYIKKMTEGYDLQSQERAVTRLSLMRLELRTWVTANTGVMPAKVV